MKIYIKPEGEIATWEFGTGSYCGEANDSVGIRIPGHGGMTLLRKDVVRLRKFLQYAEANWSDPPKHMFSK